MKMETREGTSSYTLLYPMAGLLVVARVEEATPTVTTEQIAAAGGMVAVNAVNLRARVWRTQQGERRMSVKADKITPIVPASPSAPAGK